MLSAIAAMALPLIKNLAGNGLTTLVEAISAKGQKVVEDILGVDLDKMSQTEDGLRKLRELEVEHEEKLLEIAIEEKKLDYKFLAENQKEVTKRWQSDNKAGGLNKLVRPCSLIFLLLVYSLMAFLDGDFFPIKEVYAKGFETLLFIVVPSYFGARCLEKIKGKDK